MQKRKVEKMKKTISNREILLVGRGKNQTLGEGFDLFNWVLIDFEVCGLRNRHTFLLSKTFPRFIHP